MPQNYAGGTRFVSDSPEATRAFAAKFAKTLPDDAFVALSGDLGTGKPRSSRESPRVLEFRRG